MQISLKNLYKKNMLKIDNIEKMVQDKNLDKNKLLTEIDNLKNDSMLFEEQLLDFLENIKMRKNKEDVISEIMDSFGLNNIKGKK